MLSYAASVGQSLVESVFGPGTEEVPPSFDNIIKSLQTQQDEATRFGAVLDRLAGMQLNATSFQQIADAGPEALAAAEALLAQGPAGIAQVNALQGTIDAVAKRAGTSAAQYLYGAGVETAQGVVDGLVAQQATLEKQMKHLGDVLGQAIAEAVNATIKGITIKIPKHGGGGGGADRNATGTLSAMGGWSMVGERGRELVKLPGRSRVYPSHTTERMVESRTVESPVTIEQNYYGPTTSGDRLRELEWTLRYATKARGAPA